MLGWFRTYLERRRRRAARAAKMAAEAAEMAAMLEGNAPRPSRRKKKWFGRESAAPAPAMLPPRRPSMRTAFGDMSSFSVRAADSEAWGIEAICGLRQ